MKNPKPIKDKLTVVIPAKNEVKYISGILTDLCYQMNARGLRVIVADGGSTDGTIELVEDLSKVFSDRLNIELIKGGTVSQGRNAGLNLASTPYILFIDADVRLPDLLHLQETVNLLLRKRLVGTLIRCKGSFLSGFSFVLFNAVNRQMSKFRPFALGSYFGARVSDIKKFGGWDEEVVHSEDWIMSRNYKPKEFVFSKYHIEIDDRRFKKSGHLKMMFMLFKSMIMGRNYQTKDNGYWD
jgi:glycosyltransferase involved in cell wall biosynthesis